MCNKKRGSIAKVMTYCEQTKLKVCEDITSLSQLQLGRCNSPPQGRASLGVSSGCPNCQFFSQHGDSAVAQHLLVKG